MGLTSGSGDQYWFSSLRTFDPRFLDAFMMLALELLLLTRNYTRLVRLGQDYLEATVHVDLR